MKKNTHWKCIALLAGMTSLSAQAVSSGPESRPHPENFPSYSLYLQALFDFQRAQSPAAAKASATAAAASAPTESLEDAIANAGSNPGYVDTSTHPRSTFSSFGLAPIPAQDMSQNGVENALGIFSGHELEQPPATTARLRPDSDARLIPDVEPRLISDAYDMLWENIASSAQEIFSGYIALPEGEAYASASVVKGSEHGLDLTLSSKVRSNIYIIDEDGVPQTGRSFAGAIAVQPLSLQLTDLTSHITVLRSSNNDDLISIQSSSSNPLFIDLSGSRIGTASAGDTKGPLVLSRKNLGEISYFASFGPNALLTIAPGMSLNIKLGHPDGMNKPLVTLNGRISDINVGDISVLGNDRSDDSAGAHIGKMSITGLNLIDLRLYIKDQTVVIDMGRGVRDMAVSMERIAMGSNTSASSMIGDLYVEHIGIANSRISIAAH